MGKCISCGREIDEKSVHVYGVIQKQHIDNRHDTAEIDSGPTWYTPVALIRIGVCPDCSRSIGNDGIKKGIGMVLGGLAVFAIALLISSHSSSEATGVVGLLGLFLFGAGMYGVIRTAFSRVAAKEKLAPAAVSGKLKPEWVICPQTEQEIDVTEVSGAAVTHFYTYQYVGEKELRKPPEGKGKENSRARALDTLRTWAAENRVFG